LVVSLAGKKAGSESSQQVVEQPTGLRRATCLLATLLAASLLTGCVTLPDPEVGQDLSNDTIEVLSPGRSAGQTFIARRPRLAAIEVWLSRPTALASAAPSTLVAQLYHAPGETTPLATAELAIDGAEVPSPVRVGFPSRKDPPGTQYYLRLTADSAPLAVHGRKEDVYGGGQAFIDEASTEADIAFRLLYDYDAVAMVGDLGSLPRHLWLALPLTALLLLPGWLLLDLSKLRTGYDGGEQVALATGLSLSLLPLLLLWSTVVGVRWNRPLLVSALVLLATMMAIRLLYMCARRPAGRDIEFGHRPRPRQDAGAWTLAGIFVVSMAVRLIMVRDLAGPAWVDSVHHALITQLIVQQGGLPATYAPFVNVGTAAYHAGFHSMAAAFLWISRLDVTAALLLLGQVLNALMVPATYLLAKNLTRDRVAGLGAALVVGLFSPMPAYYVSWGRYTQLTGLLILPTAFVLTQRAVSPSSRRETATADAGGDRLRLILITAVALAGLLLVHYRIAAFCGCLLVAHLLSEHGIRGKGLRQAGRDALWLGVASGGAVVLTWPWLFQTWTTLWRPKLLDWSRGDPTSYMDFSWDYLLLGQGKYVLLLAMAGLGWAMWRRQRCTVSVVMWVGFMLLLASAGILGLPGSGFVSFTSVEIVLFLPFCTLAGYLISRFLGDRQEAFPPQRKRLHQGLLGLLTVSAMLFGAWTMLPILNPDTVLLHQSDKAAMAWIQEHTTPDARFLINPTPWSAGLYAGRDGGYWISPLAGRETIPPPVLYGLGSHEEVLAINRLCESVIEYAADPPRLAHLLRSSGVDFVYLGARGGVLSAELLTHSSHFGPVYSEDGVWVFELLTPDSVSSSKHVRCQIP
jgi:hypothetical protein